MSNFRFPICLIILSLKFSLKNKIIYTYKRSFNEQSIFSFKNEDNETEYKNYKKLFEAIKKRSIKNYFSKLTLNFKSNIRKTRKLLKTQLAKVNVTIRIFLRKLLLII